MNQTTEDKLQQEKAEIGNYLQVGAESLLNGGKNLPYTKREAMGVVQNPIQKGYIQPFANRAARRKSNKNKPK